MRTILVTGAGSGIGKAIAGLFAQQNYLVFATDKSEGIIEGNESQSIIGMVMDVSDPNSVEAAATVVRSHTDGLDVLVNNAGVFDQFPLVEGGQEGFRTLIETNLMGPDRVTRALFPLLKKRKGRVINICSESAMSLLPFQVYGLSKRMLEDYSNVLGQELALIGMNVSVIRPGAHLTPFIKRSHDALDEVPEGSLFAKYLEVVKVKGQEILNGVRRDPIHVAKAVYRASVDPNPKRIYDVNVSLRFRVLSLLPEGLKQRIIRRVVKG